MRKDDVGRRMTYLEADHPSATVPLAATDVGSRQPDPDADAMRLDSDRLDVGDDRLDLSRDCLDVADD